MKKWILLTLLAFFSSLAWTQSTNALKSLSYRTKGSELVFEGKVIAKFSFEDEKKTMIYTANTVEIYKVFKGEVTTQTLDIVTLGGEINERYTHVHHSLQFEIGQEGVFFCEQKKIGNMLMLGATIAPISYDFQSAKVLASDGLNMFSDIERELYPSIERITHKFQKIAPNTAEKKLASWLRERNLTHLLATQSDNGIIFSLENPYFSGNNQYLEFDVFAQGYGIDKFGKSEVYLDYAVNTFGSYVVSNNGVTVTKGSVILSSDYTLTIADETAQKIKIQIDAVATPTNLHALGFVSEQLCHIVLDISNFMIPGNVGFDEMMMQGLSEQYLSGTYAQITDVIANDSLINNINNTQSATAINYSFVNLNVTDSAGIKFAEFDVYTLPNNAGTKISHGTIYFDYSTDVFGYYVLGNSKIQVTRGNVIQDANIYDYYTTDDDYNTSMIFFYPVNTNDSTGLYSLASTQSEQVCHVKMEIALCNLPMDLPFVPTLMDNQSLYWSGVAMPYEAYSPTNADDTLTQSLCNVASVEIYSFSPSHISSGTKSVLTISGVNFGASQGKVFYRPIDSPLAWIEAPDSNIVSWTDTEIKAQVPSICATGAGAQTGPIRVTTASQQSDDSGNDKLIVDFAVKNIYNVNLDRGILINLPNVNGQGGLTFQLTDSLANIPNATLCIDSAIRQWRCATHVNFYLGSNANVSLNPVNNDGVSSIGFIDFDSLWLSIGILDTTALAITKEAGGIKYCQDAGGANTPFIQFVDEIDIGIRKNLHKYNGILQLPFAYVMSGGISFTYLDFYSIILHELGHAQRLTHVLDTTKVMRSNNSLGSIPIRLLHPMDVMGGDWVMNNNEIAIDSTSIYWACNTNVLVQPGDTLFPPMWKDYSCGVNSIENSLFHQTILQAIPNPNTSTFNLLWDSQKAESYTLYLFDRLGRKLKTWEFGKADIGRNTREIQVIEIPNGIYLLYLQTDTQQGTQKLWIQR